MEELSDYELIRSYLGGQETAFEALYARHRKRLYGYLNSLLPGRTAEADEIFQLTWIRVVKHLPKYRDQGCFAAWLFRMARNLLIDRIRREQRGGLLTILDGEDTPPLPSPAGSEPWRNLDEHDLKGAIHLAVSELPPQQREVFLMRCNEDMPFKEIAAIQKCSINTVLARMQYALKHLRSRLTAMDKGGLLS